MIMSWHFQRKNKYDSLIKKLIKKTQKGFELDLSYFSYYTFDKQKYMFSEKFIDEFGEPRIKDSKITKRHQEIAGAMQRVFIDVCKHIFFMSKKMNKSNNLVFSGGSAMNSVLNGMIDNFGIYKNSHISYAPDDSGVAIGAALLASHKYGKKTRKFKEVKTNFFGPSTKFK